MYNIDLPISLKLAIYQYLTRKRTLQLQKCFRVSLFESMRNQLPTCESVIIGREIMTLMTKSWNLASLNLIFKFYFCYIQQLILIIA